MEAYPTGRSATRLMLEDYERRLRDIEIALKKEWHDFHNDLAVKSRWAYRITNTAVFLIEIFPSAKAFRKSIQALARIDRYRSLGLRLATKGKLDNTAIHTTKSAVKRTAKTTLKHKYPVGKQDFGHMQNQSFFKGIGRERQLAIDKLSHCMQKVNEDFGVDSLLTLTSQLLETFSLNSWIARIGARGGDSYQRYFDKLGEEYAKEWTQRKNRLNQMKRNLAEAKREFAKSQI